ncbi:hypothetical protein [Symbioplanes lichenis]|uniref:hypothetical protein n=1 Tax=Symbioplanes lichenis TaxID=1629072 RepID=UPI0027396B87|nr:hypothetical protein [Actinoplanes lichenis]
MWLLARFVQRGGHPAAVAPTVELRAGEKQYGAFPADVLSYSSDGVYVGGGLFWGGGIGTADEIDEGRSRAGNKAKETAGKKTGKEAEKPRGTSDDESSAAPTTDEDQWQPRDRQGVTVTSERLLLVDARGGVEEHDFRDLILVQPNPLDWSVNLYFQGTQPIMLRSPWIPWMTVVLCAELYGSPWPPGQIPGSDLPATAVC